VAQVLFIDIRGWFCSADVVHSLAIF